MSSITLFAPSIVIDKPASIIAGIASSIDRRFIFIKSTSVLSRSNTTAFIKLFSFFINKTLNHILNHFLNLVSKLSWKWSKNKIKKDNFTSQLTSIEDKRLPGNYFL